MPRAHAQGQRRCFKVPALRVQLIDYMLTTSTCTSINTVTHVTSPSCPPSHAPVAVLDRKGPYPSFATAGNDLLLVTLVLAARVREAALEHALKLLWVDFLVVLLGIHIVELDQGGLVETLPLRGELLGIRVELEAQMVASDRLVDLG